MLHEQTLPLVLLLIGCNGAPIIARNLLGSVGEIPIDGEWVTSSGSRLLGASKTVRGVAAAVLTGAVLSWLLNLGMVFGVLFALISMFGDLLSSFIKRRLGLASSASAPGIDQVPESLFPLLFAKAVLELSWLQVGVAVLLFVALEIVLSPVLFCLKIRRKPY